MAVGSERCLSGGGGGGGGGLGSVGGTGEGEGEVGRLGAASVAAARFFSRPAPTTAAPAVAGAAAPTTAVPVGSPPARGGCLGFPSPRRPQSSIATHTPSRPPCPSLACTEETQTIPAATNNKHKRKPLTRLPSPPLPSPHRGVLAPLASRGKWGGRGGWGGAARARRSGVRGRGGKRGAWGRVGGVGGGWWRLPAAARIPGWECVRAWQVGAGGGVSGGLGRLAGAGGWAPHGALPGGLLPPHPTPLPIV